MIGSVCGLLLVGSALASASMAALWQLARWRASPANAGRTARAGPWSWSRHANYFFGGP